MADATWTSRRLSHGNLTDLQHKYLRKSQQTQADDTPLDGQTFLRVRPSSHGQTSAVDQIDSPPLYREPRRSPDRVGTHVGRMASNRLPLRNPSSYRQPDLVYSDKPQNREPSPLRQEMRGVYLNLDPQTSSETDSVASSVPSTVWDELQVMKERIASIERAGGRDPAQLAGPVRPQTATNTTATTMSSSPHQVSGAPVGPPGTEKLHPLLHSAVLKARETTKPDITRSLDQCAMDALSLAAIIGTSGSASGAQSTVGSVSGSERQVRRKVESMCRSLTELAIALSDGSATHLIGHPSGEFMPPQYATQRLPSRDGAVSVLGLQRRGSSLEPDDIQSRASARFANPVPGRQLRQASLQPYAIHDRSSLGSVYTRSRIYQDEPMSSPIISTSRFPSGLTRSSTIALRRGQPTFDGANDSNEAEEDEPEQISGRAPSRARTEIGRSTSYQVASAREYRSIHALPIRQYSRNTVVETAPLPNATKAATFPLAQKEQPGQRGGEMSEEEKRAKMRQLAERTRGPDLSRAGGLKPSPRRRRQDVTSIDSTKTIGPDDVLGLKYAQRA